jgi:putative transposase
MARSRYKIGEDGYPYFMTCTIVGWLPVFTRPEMVQVIFDSWHFLQNNDRMLVFGYVILENHLHLIASAEDLSKEIGDFKSFCARKIIDLLLAKGANTILKQLQFQKAPHKIDRVYQLWQEASTFIGIQSSEATWTTRHTGGTPVRGTTRGWRVCSRL